MPDPLEFPRLRPVEVAPSRTTRGAIELTDRAGICPGPITVSSLTLSILARMNGRNRASEIQADFLRRTGRMLYSDELDHLVAQLDEACFLLGPRFEDRWSALTAAYRAEPFRRLRDADTLGAPRARLPEYLDSILASAPPCAGRIAALVAPHLDYDRGAPCYAAAYRDLPARTDARRFVILGTNHFGRGTSVVGTTRDFETPWGVVPCDTAFMQRIDARCDASLCEFEFDHAREHSVELQVILLKHLLGNRPFTIAPYLCPDPCGPTGTRPFDGRGPDLRAFAGALRDELAADSVPTCLIAGADLSHVGRFFNDDRGLDSGPLAEVEQSDRAALAFITAGDPESFRQSVARTGNATNICSVGCIYALAVALHGRASPRLLHYHQALIPRLENCVTSAALEFTLP